MASALEDLSIPAPIEADESSTGPAALAMAAAALDDVDAGELVDRIEPATTSGQLARWALGFGYHVYLSTPEEPDAIEATLLDAGLQLRSEAQRRDVRTALEARHPLVLSAPGDGPPFLLVVREEEHGLVVDDPSLEDAPLTWSWDRLDDLLTAQPAPRVLELAPRSRAEN